MPLSPPPRESEGLSHLIVDDPNSARKAFARVGCGTTKADVLEVELPNTPGAPARFDSKLADKNINITALETG